MTDIEKLLLMTYQECVNFLLKKHGRVPKDYFTNKGCKVTNGNANSRTKDGLEIHHIDEDKAIMLSSPSHAQTNPFEFQRANRLVYCNLLEHLVLHIKIVESPNPRQNRGERCGVGGISNFLAPELNDIYSGIIYNQEWKNALAKKVLLHRDDYLKCIKRLVDMNFNYPLLKSFNEAWGLWSASKNSEIFSLMRSLGVKS